MSRPADDIHVRFYQRRHLREQESAAIRDAPSIYKQGSLIVGDHGKHHFEPMYSHAEEWRSGMRLVQGVRVAGDDYVERGKKYIGPPDTSGLTKEWHEQRKHNLEEYTRRSGHCYDLTQNFTKLKKFTPKLGIAGQNAVVVEDAIQYDMEGFMNRKQRSGASIERMRNGIPVVVEGDRAFKEADREPGYYAKGGLIPGSSIQARKSAKKTMRKSEDVSNSASKPRKPTMSFAEKVQKKLADYEAAQVFLLSEAGEKQGQAVPSFEQRTGLYLVRPEDEKD